MKAKVQGAVRTGYRKPKGAKDRVKGLDRELRALELRKAGASYTMIAKDLECSVEGARKALMRALEWMEETCAELAPAVRRIELERLDAMHLGVWDKARRGDPQAIDRALALMRQRARFTPGLEITPGIEIGGPNGGPITTSSPEAGLLLQRFDAISRAIAAGESKPAPLTLTVAAGDTEPKP
jgi:hypothetical protein